MALVALLLLLTVKLGPAIPWEQAIPAGGHTDARFRPDFALAGLTVGFMVGLTGMGSGALMAPVPIFVLHVTSSLAIATFGASVALAEKML